MRISSAKMIASLSASPRNTASRYCASVARISALASMAWHDSRHAKNASRVIPFISALILLRGFHGRHAGSERHGIFQRGGDAQQQIFLPCGSDDLQTDR